jgi:hypothetical protein
MKLKS